MHLTWKAAHQQGTGGVGVRRETTRRGYFRVQWGRWELSFQHPLSCSLPKYQRSPPPKPRVAPIGSRIPDLRTLSLSDGDPPPAYQHSPPPTLHPLRRQAQLPPPDAATEPGSCKRSWRNPSFHTGRLASFHLREERRVEESVRGLGNK